MTPLLLLQLLHLYLPTRRVGVRGLPPSPPSFAIGLSLSESPASGLAFEACGGRRRGRFLSNGVKGKRGGDGGGRGTEREESQADAEDAGKDAVAAPPRRGLRRDGGDSPSETPPSSPRVLLSRWKLRFARAPGAEVTFPPHSLPSLHSCTHTHTHTHVHTFAPN